MSQKWIFNLINLYLSLHLSLATLLLLFLVFFKFTLIIICVLEIRNFKVVLIVLIIEFTFLGFDWYFLHTHHTLLVTIFVGRVTLIFN